MSRFIFLLMLVPTLASAQLISLRRQNFPTDTTWTFGAGDCTTKPTIQWQLSTTTIASFCSPLKLWVTSGECGETQGTLDHPLGSVDYTIVQLQRTGTLTFDLALFALIGFNGTTEDGGTAPSSCGASNITKTHKVCGAIGTSTGASCLQQAASSLTLVYDAVAPAAPGIVSVTAEDSAASISFTVDPDTTDVFAEVQGPNATEFSKSAEVSSSTALIRVRNLVNGETWKVRLVAKDAAGNASTPSEEREVIPVKTVGFFGVYREQGGTDTGGCSTAGFALVPFAALAVARALARRSRRS